MNVPTNVSSEGRVLFPSTLSSQLFRSREFRRMFVAGTVFCYEAIDNSTEASYFRYIYVHIASKHISNESCKSF